MEDRDGPIADRVTIEVGDVHRKRDYTHDPALGYLTDADVTDATGAGVFEEGFRSGVGRHTYGDVSATTDPGPGTIARE